MSAVSDVRVISCSADFDQKYLRVYANHHHGCSFNYEQSPYLT